ncbi:hypothetical protein Tco_0666861 [Tanacetum coccineum]
MENSKRGWVTAIVKKYFSDSQCPTTCKERRRMGKVLYASTIGSIIVKDYIDASFQTDHNDTKSQSSYMFIMNGRAVAGGAQKGLGVVSSIENPVKVYCDNSSTILLASECIIQRGSRHILRRHHYIHEAIGIQNVEVIKVHTDDNIVDPLTKALLV